MKQLSKERLEKIASWREKFGADHNVMLTAEEAEAMARALLARMDQEPVAMRWRWKNPEMWNLGEWWYHEPRHYALLSKSDDRECEYVYAAPPAPVVPDAWIPCSDRMPEPNVYVLVSNGVWVGQGLHSNGEHLEDDERWQDEHQEFIDLLHHPVTHWQPLPAPPKER